MTTQIIPLLGPGVPTWLDPSVRRRKPLAGLVLCQNKPTSEADDGRGKIPRANPVWDENQPISRGAKRTWIARDARTGLRFHSANRSLIDVYVFFMPGTRFITSTWRLRRKPGSIAVRTHPHGQNKPNFGQSWFLLRCGTNPSRPGDRTHRPGASPSIRGPDHRAQRCRISFVRRASSN
jgi:hypothetical protein